MTATPVRRAILSVWDKRGIVPLAKRLTAAGVELISSGGTAATLADEGVAVRSVAEVTGAAEMLDGRVKTLHPAVHAGILADRGSDDHLRQLDAGGIVPIDLVVVNLYPFEDTVAGGSSPAEIVENIDIGGPTMVRAAAKNHAWVGVVTTPDQYEEVAGAVEAGGLDDGLRMRLARAAFAHTAAYDAAITSWFAGGDDLPEHLVLAFERARTLRYGENPQQQAALYRRRRTDPWWDLAVQHQGKELSFNNVADAEAAWRLAQDLPEAGVVVVKHTNPCGAAVRETVSAAFSAAWDCDPQSAFGGVVAMNRPLDAETASLIAGKFVELVVAPRIELEAMDALAGKRNLRVLDCPPPHGRDLDLRRVEDGLLVQARAPVASTADQWEVVSVRQPSEEEVSNLMFAWVVAAHTKSNAIVVARDRSAVGVGAGDQSRVGAAERALAKAGERSMGAVAASDAFFPFRDGLDALARAGVTAVVEPGGSRRDDEVVAAADESGLALLFTGERQFRH